MKHAEQRPHQFFLAKIFCAYVFPLRFFFAFDFVRFSRHVLYLEIFSSHSFFILIFVFLLSALVDLLFYLCYVLFLLSRSLASMFVCESVSVYKQAVNNITYFHFSTLPRHGAVRLMSISSSLTYIDSRRIYVYMNWAAFTRQRRQLQMNSYENITRWIRLNEHRIWIRIIWSSTLIRNFHGAHKRNANL